MVPSSNTLDLLAGTRGWRSGTPIVLTCGLCRRRRWSPRRNRLSGRRGRHNLGGRPGFDTKWMALRVPAWGRNVMCQCFHPSPTTRRSGQQDGLLRARSGLAAQLRRATRTGLCQRRRYESPCCAADDATRVGIIGRCGDVGKRRIWSGGEDRCSSVARSGGPGCHRRSGARSTAVEYGRAAPSRCRARQCPLRDRASSLL